MSSGSEQDEQLTESESDEELQSLGSQSEGEGQGEEDSDSDLGDLEEGDDGSEDDEENAGLVINEDQSTDDEDNSSEDDDEEEQSESNDEEVASEAEDDNEGLEESEHNSDEDGKKSNPQDDDGAKKVPNDLRLKIFNKIKRRYENRLGKTLFVRFPHRLPEDTAEVLSTLKEFSSRVSKVRRMRQKYARYCLVDFESNEDREKGLEELKKGKIDGKNLVVAYPRSEAPDFIEQATEKRLNKITQNTIKSKLKKLVKEKKKLKTKIFTSTVIVKNIPPSAQLPEIKALFPQAVEVKVNFAKGKNEKTTATVTMPTPEAATQVKKSKLKMNDSVLQINFPKTDLPNPAASGEGKDTVASETAKKGKRKLKVSTSEFSSPPKKNKISNKPGDPNKKVKNVGDKKPNKKTLAKDEGNESPTNFKVKKPWGEMSTDGSNKKPKPQFQNPNSKQPNFKDKKQRKQKNPNTIKNGSSETVEPIGGSDDVPNKQKFGQEEKGTQNQKLEFPVMEKEDGQNKKSMFPIMKKNLQGKGVKSGKVFKNKQFKTKW